VEGLDQIFEYVRTGGTLGLLALATKLYVDLRTLKMSNKAAERDADFKLEEHRDGLTFQLLEAARTELNVLRDEIKRLRPADNHLQLFETALEHIEALLSAEPDSREGIERSARAFLNRVRRLQTARGTLTNEFQRLESGVHVAERTAKDEGSTS
jgi:hypothetical protein